MRANPTEPERRLWIALRNSRFFAYKFRRQAVIGFRIVDLFCPAKGLVIELDGQTHDPEVDFSRDMQMLRDFGFRTMRFTNHELMTNPEGVLAALKMALDAQPERWPNRRTNECPSRTSPSRPNGADDTGARLTTR
jgi:very-short-patch-repair endonuclease